MNIKFYITFLRLETAQAIESLNMPPWIDILKDITTDVGYRSSTLCKEDYYIYPEDLDYLYEAEIEPNEDS